MLLNDIAVIERLLFGLVLYKDSRGHNKQSEKARQHAKDRKRLEHTLGSRNHAYTHVKPRLYSL